jgi:hypothetical protein
MLHARTHRSWMSRVNKDIKPNADVANHSGTTVGSDCNDLLGTTNSIIEHPSSIKIKTPRPPLENRPSPKYGSVTFRKTKTALKPRKFLKTALNDQQRMGSSHQLKANNQPQKGLIPKFF